MGQGQGEGRREGGVKRKGTQPLRTDRALLVADMASGSGLSPHWLSLSPSSDSSSFWILLHSHSPNTSKCLSQECELVFLIFQC